MGPAVCSRKADGKTLPTLGFSSVCIGVEGFDTAFERALGARLRDELDAISIAVPASRPQPIRALRLAFGVAAAIAVGAALLLGTVAAFAAGSPDPRVWLKQAQHSYGAPLIGEHSPMAAPSTPEPSAEPQSAAPAAPGEHESPSQAGTEHESPEPSLAEAPQPRDQGEGSRASPGDG